ncbi:SAM-dependent methyltransferase [Plantactinospora sp. S1510]|uniref:SAM-dependent methyltransferase n=1 Tax=Plantactinospora alkalitolerans TaxID=2789879 RepID=A0ABS0H2P5_9ACTN|nr:SAM-dependent methyltransferase [Plantactinospora alkalitolerans]MBF9132733.1 SAM-dependent methyltransferase [Plantactinospora alkalitolerans]
MSSRTADPDEAPRLDTSVAHRARVWDWWLGGKDNFHVDRVAGARVKEIFPEVVAVARADREFLARVVRFLVDAGVRQFLDIGTGLPRADNTHSLAQRHAPESRVVYVDNDPLVLVHARALLTGGPEGAIDYIDADVRNPDRILHAAQATLNFSEPVGVLMLGVLNFVLDDTEAHRVVHGLMNAVSSGSYLAVTHPTHELGGDANREAMKYWNAHATPPIRTRGGNEIRRLIDDLTILDPGLVSCARWRNDADAPSVPQYAAVCRKP